MKVNKDDIFFDYFFYKILLFMECVLLFVYVFYVVLVGFIIFEMKSIG